MTFLDTATHLQDKDGKQRSLLFLGSSCLELNWSDGIAFWGAIRQYNKGVTWNELQQWGFDKDIDAAADLTDVVGSPCTMLFKGDQCVVLKWDEGIDYHGKITGYKKHWADLPKGFDRDLDAVMQIEDQGGPCTMLFKKDQCVVLSWNHGIQFHDKITAYEGPWRDLPKPFSKSLDAVVRMANDDDGNQQSLLIKDSQCLVLNWENGFSYDGEVTGYSQAWANAYNRLTG
ncbi:MULTISPECIES: hypothetical protein [unclassified Streptomyces]|uniref:hypothetical protein n=1 Tax=unclassified Streptomyces TaxID=2593676 RepID=UPI001CC0836D|nr:MULTISPECIES: hypothetical protein [unclassified Streptomyces]WPO69143.1 hypothetical protein R9806_00055 [Streptomyces sp. KN37]